MHGDAAGDGRLLQPEYAICATVLSARPKAMAASLVAPQQLRQLGDIGRDPSRLVTRQQLGRRAATRLILIIDIGKLLPGAVSHDEVGGSTALISR